LPPPLLVSLALLGLALPPLAQAIPRLDLKPYPAPAVAERRWVIQLPGVLQPSPDARISANPADWRVELIVGKEMTVDCNGPRLNGRIRSETLKGWGYAIYRVSAVTRGPSTLMACPPEQGPRQALCGALQRQFADRRLRPEGCAGALAALEGGAGAARGTTAVTIRADGLPRCECRWSGSKGACPGPIADAFSAPLATCGSAD
jgi:ecotin